MKLDPATAKINIQALGQLAATVNRSEQVRNKAALAQQKADPEQKPQAASQLQQAKNSSSDAWRTSLNHKISAVKSVTAQFNNKVSEKTSDINAILAMLISPGGSPNQSVQLGRFIDKFA